MNLLDVRNFSLGCSEEEAYHRTIFLPFSVSRKRQDDQSIEKQCLVVKDKRLKSTDPQIILRGSVDLLHMLGKEAFVNAGQRTPPFAP
jgi:hypothetical protein